MISLYSVIIRSPQFLCSPSPKPQKHKSPGAQPHHRSHLPISMVSPGLYPRLSSSVRKNGENVTHFGPPEKEDMHDAQVRTEELPGWGASLSVISTLSSRSRECILSASLATNPRERSHIRTDARLYPRWEKSCCFVLLLLLRSA